MTKHLLDFDGVPEVTVRPGVTTRTIAGGEASLVMVRVAAGTAAAAHSHPYEQFVYVVFGSGMLETEAGRGRFGPGSVFHFPAGTSHSAIFETDTVLVETNLAGATPREHGGPT